MPSNFTSVTVTWYDDTDDYATSSNITNDVKSVPLFTDSGTGEVNQATVVVRSLHGNYNTTGSVKFAEFDRIRIQCTDLASNSYDRYFEIISILPSQTKGEGTLLTLECLGIEYHTQHIFMSKPYYFEDSYTVATSIGNIYNNNRGTKQPKLDSHNIVFTPLPSPGLDYGNGLPFYNANNWEFGINEDTCYNRWMDLVDGGGASVDAGGALTFFELSFDTTSVNDIRMKLRPAGNNTTIVQVKNAVATGVKVGEQEGMLSNPTGTNLLAWGSSDHGSLPLGMSKYESKLLQFIFRPEWSTGISYAIDAKVKVTNTTTTIEKHYKCLVAHTSGTFATDLAASKWTQIDMADEFGNTIKYSPWTDDKKNVWSNSGCNPSRSLYTSGGWFDINIVVNDNIFFRTWVDGTAYNNTTLEALADNYSYNSQRVTLPRGFRVLVIGGSAAGDLEKFDNMVVEYQPNNSVGGKLWRRLYKFSSDQDGAQVAVLDEGKVYKFSSSTGWASIASSKYGNDCFHPYTTAPANVDGIDLVNQPTNGWITRSKITDSTNRPDISKSAGEFLTNQDSAIKFIADPLAISDANADAHDPLDPWYGHSIGFNLRFPYPCSNHNSITEGVGELYGGGTSKTWADETAYVEGDIVYNSNTSYICNVAHISGTFATDLTNKKWNQLVGQEPATLDIQNMNYTHDGQEGFNAVTNSAEDFGQINAVAFWLRFNITKGGVVFDDEHSFRAFFIDTKDNVVYQDFVVKFGNNWEDIILPISGFTIYRGRKPLYAYEVPTSSMIPLKELEVTNIFEWRNIKIFGVQHNIVYDEFGRFNPVDNAVHSTTSIVTWATALSATRTLEMDGFRFIKPLLAITDNDTSRNIQPTFQQFPNVSVYDQLVNIAKSHLEIEKFKHKEFNIESTGDAIFDIKFGESFHLNNVDIVNENERNETSVGSNDGDDGTIKLVAKRIEYSVTKPTTGKGGLRRKIKGAKVFT